MVKYGCGTAAALERGVDSLGVSRAECCAFTGYRPGKFGLSFPSGDAECAVREMLRPVLRELYIKGIRVFLTGMAEGFDMWAALEVIRLRDEGACPDAGVGAIVPYKGQSRRYGSRALEDYDYILREAAFTAVLSAAYFPECFHRRNDFLVDNASVVVCYYDGQRGGTQYTVNRARRMRVPLINLYVSEPLLF